MTFAPGSPWSGLEDNIHEFFLQKAKQEQQWSLRHMAVVLANDHDLKNGKKSNDFSEL
jgi:hypothetical protein